MKELTFQQEFVVSKEQVEKKSRSGWYFLLLITTVGSAGCMLAGLTVSLLSGLEVITVSATIAYITIGLLFGSFSLIFLTAHCMDRVASIDKAESRAISHQRERLASSQDRVPPGVGSHA